MIHLFFTSGRVLQQEALQSRSVAAHGVRGHATFPNAPPPLTVMWSGVRRDFSGGPSCAAWRRGCFTIKHFSVKMLVILKLN